MFSVWRLLPVRVTQFSQAVAAHKSLLSATFWFCIFSSSSSSFSTMWGSPIVLWICVPAINNWAFHLCHLWIQETNKRMERAWRKAGGDRQEEEEKENRCWWKKRGKCCTVSVECAVCSLISSARKVWRGGGRRGQKEKTRSAQRCWVWIYVSVRGQGNIKCTCTLPFCKQKIVLPPY